MGFFRKTSPRRSQVRRNIPVERFTYLDCLTDGDTVISLLLWLLFIVICIPLVSFRLLRGGFFRDLSPLAMVIVLISVAAGLYIRQYQGKIITNHARAAALLGLFIVLLSATKIGALANQSFWATGAAVIAATILTIAYEQRFAIGMSIFYNLFACFAAEPLANAPQAAASYQLANISLFLTMSAGAITCCFSLKEIRTRMKLLQVSAIAAVIVFLMATAVNFLDKDLRPMQVFQGAAYHAGITLIVGVLIQGLLPVIEKTFRIATSMTLLDYSDANQPLLKRLAMEAPGTFSHSLLIGSLAEAGAESIDRNGLLCRVGAYYHDIGKINKPSYFVENEMGMTSRHKELSPTMSQLIIVGHVKDGIEMAKEYGLPAVLRQFIETHHGTTLVEPFYHEAKKKHESPDTDASIGKKRKQPPPSESEFRYPGPKPRTKEAAIVMLADAAEGAVRSLPEATPTKIEIVVHNMSMKRLQDGQFDECDLSLRELSRIETAMAKTLAAHYHGRIAYPEAPDQPMDEHSQTVQNE